MKCLTDEELTDQIFGETGSERKKEAAEHLSACPACRNRLAALNFSASAAAAVRPAPVSENFTSNLMAKIRAEGADAPVRKSAGFFSRLTPKKVVFAACALTLFIAVISRPGRVPLPSASPAFYLADGSATPVRLATLIPSDRLDSGNQPAGLYYSDSCRTAGCGR